MHTQQQITSTGITCSASGAGAYAFDGIKGSVRIASASALSISIIRIIKGR